MKVRHLFLTLLVSVIALSNLQAQVKVIAAPGDMKSAAKTAFAAHNLPANDTTNIYNNLLNDSSDDLMENHPADDLYNEIWNSERINPYNMPVSQLPETIEIDLKDFVMPVSTGRVSSNFGPRRYRYHYGIDIALPTGNPVVSAFKGKVRIIKYDPRGYGKYVVVRHDNGLETVYAHLSQISCEVNDEVNAGDQLGLSGNTGRSTGPHLHFETRYVGNAFNPANIIDFNNHRVYADNYTLSKRKNFGYQQQRAQTAQLAKYYKVRKGDSLSRIAARNGTTVNNLKRLNGIKNPNNLRVGQRIRIR